MLFPPHVLDKIGRKELFRRPVHPLIFAFHVGPGTFYCLGVSTRSRVDKVCGMIYSLMDVAKCWQLPVCCPLICLHSGTCCNVSLNQREQSGSISCCHNFHKHFLSAPFNAPNDPAAISIATTIIFSFTKFRFINLYNLPPATNYCGCLRIYSAHVSRQKLYQSITVFSPTPVHLTVVRTGISSLQRYVSSRIVPTLRWLFENHEFCRIAALLLQSCFEHHHLYTCTQAQTYEQK